jgi:hypothetical protein
VLRICCAARGIPGKLPALTTCLMYSVWHEPLSICLGLTCPRMTSKALFD